MMTLNTLIKVRLICLTLLFAVDAHALSVARPANQAQPNISAQIQIEGHKFDHSVLIHFKNEVDLEYIKKLTTNGQIMNDISDWVTDAKYQADDFTLSIGKFGIEYTHDFTCTDEFQSAEWSKLCLEKRGASNDDVVIKNGIISVDCQADSVSGVNCEYRMAGDAQDLKFLMKKIAGRDIAYILFVENTKYLAHLSLLLSGQATSIEQARQIFAQTEYRQLISELESKAPSKNKSASDDEPFLAHAETGALVPDAFYANEDFEDIDLNIDFAFGTKSDDYRNGLMYQVKPEGRNKGNKKRKPTKPRR
jgi:hypothetical protein